MNRQFTVENDSTAGNLYGDAEEIKIYSTFMKTYQRFSSQTMFSQLARRGM